MVKLKNISKEYLLIKWDGKEERIAPGEIFEKEDLVAGRLSNKFFGSLVKVEDEPMAKAKVEVKVEEKPKKRGKK